MDKTSSFAVKVSADLIAMKIASLYYIADAVSCATKSSDHDFSEVTRDMAIQLNFELSAIASLAASIADIANECHPRG